MGESAAEFREHLWLLLSGGRNSLLSGTRQGYVELAGRFAESPHLNLIQLDMSRT